MTIRLNDLTCIIKFENKNEEKVIKKFVTYDDTSAAFCGGSWHPERVKKVCFGKDVKGYFVVFAGLCREIMLEAKRNNFNITSFEDARTHFDFQKKEWTHDELRKFFDPRFKYVEHQIKSLQAMLKTNCAILKLATSAGKSKIMSAFIRLTKLPTLILVNKVDLGIQLQQGFIEDGIDCGICSGSKYKDGECLVSTIQSVKKIPNLEKFKMVLADECHNSSAATYQDFLKQFGCPLKYGFSASPMRKGDLLGFAKIRQFFGSIAIDIGSEELIENNVMAKPHIYLVKNECSRDEYFDYQSAYSEEVVNSRKRNQLVADITDKYKTGVLIVVNLVEHGEILEKLIPNSVFISGITPTEDRQKYLKMFDSGELPVLIGSTILQEGISITHMKAMVLACGGKSNVAILQKIGRSLRYKEGEKTEVDFYDFIDTARYIANHSKERVRLYKKAGFKDMTLLDENLEKIE